MCVLPCFLLYVDTIQRQRNVFPVWKKGTGTQVIIIFTTYKDLHFWRFIVVTNMIQLVNQLIIRIRCAGSGCESVKNIFFRETLWDIACLSPQTSACDWMTDLHVWLTCMSACMTDLHVCMYDWPAATPGWKGHDERGLCDPWKWDDSIAKNSSRKKIYPSKNAEIWFASILGCSIPVNDLAREHSSKT